MHRTKNKNMRCAPIKLLLFAIASFAPAAFAQVTGFAVTSDASSAAAADRLHSIDLQTGTAMMIGPLGPGFEDVEGLAFDQQGALFGIDDATKTLVSIAAGTGRATALGSGLGNTRLAVGEANAQDPSLAFNCRNELFVLTKNSRSLYRGTVSTGTLELIGAAGAAAGKITDIAFRGEELFGLGDDALFSINTSTGVTRQIGAFAAGISFVEGGGLSVDNTGKLWAIAEIRRADASLDLSAVYQIDPLTGVATRVSSTLAGIESLSIGAAPCNLGVLGGTPTLVSQVPVNSRSAIFLLALMTLFAGFIAGRKFSQ
jgi:hypothetical protein